MRLSKHTLLTRRKGFLILSLVFFNHIGAFGNLATDVAVPFSSFNKSTTSDLFVPLQQQHSVEIIQGAIQPKKPANYKGVKAAYKATPINIHPDNIQSYKGNLYKMPSVNYPATAHKNAGGGAFATTPPVATKKPKTINQTNKVLTQVGAAQPVIMRAAGDDDDDDDDWNPGGTGGFDNPGEPPVIPVPVGGGVLSLLLMAMGYALRRRRKLHLCQARH